MQDIKDLDFKLSVITASLRDCSARLYKLSTESEKLAKKAKKGDTVDNDELVALCDGVVGQALALNMIPGRISLFIKDCMKEESDA